MRTTNKTVVRKLEQHVLENFWPKNYGSGHIGLQNLKDQIDYMRHDDRTIYQTALDYVEGGGLLISFGDVQDFLNGLGINETGKAYSDEKAWKLYCHLIARTMSQLYASRVKELERLGKVA